MVGPDPYRKGSITGNYEVFFFEVEHPPVPLKNQNHQNEINVTV
jgi:hypothetical protein